MFPQLTFIFSLWFTNYGCFLPWLLFPYFTCLVFVMLCVFSWEEFVYRTFEDCIGLFISHYCFFYFRISTKQYPCCYDNFPKVPVHLFIINYQNIIFWQFIFNFDVYCVSRKFITYSCLHICQKGLLTRFILSAVLWENG